MSIFFFFLWIIFLFDNYISILLMKSSENTYFCLFLSILWMKKYLAGKTIWWGFNPGPHTKVLAGSTRWAEETHEIKKEKLTREMKLYIVLNNYLSVWIIGRLGYSLLLKMSDLWTNEYGWMFHDSLAYFNRNMNWGLFNLNFFPLFFINRLFQFYYKKIN